MSDNIFNIYKAKLLATSDNLDRITQKSMEEMEEDFLERQDVRIYKQGVYVDSVKMQTDEGKDHNSVYSPSTLGKSDHVDLYNTGDFLDSMSVIADKFALEFKAEFEKEDRHIADHFTLQSDNDNDFVNKVLGVSAEDWEFQKPFFVKAFIKEFFKEFATK